MVGLAGGAAVFFAGQVKIRLAAAVVGVAGGIGCALLSRNPRLFCLWCLGFSVPFMFAKTIGPVLNKGGGEVAFNIDVTDVFVLVLGLFLAHDIYTGRRPGIRIPKACYYWMAIMAIGAYAVIAGPYRSTASHEIFRMVKMMALFLVLVQELETPRRTLHWCGAITSGLIVNALVGLAQYHYHMTFGLADLGEPSEDGIKTLAATSVNGVEVWRVGAFLQHPNIFGAFLAALLPLTLACFLLRGGKIQKVYFLAAFVLGAGALLVTNSRSGWISFAAAFASFLAISAGHAGMRRRSSVAVVAVGILLVGIAVVAHEQIAQRLFDSKEEALSFREVFKEDAKRMIADKPLWGMGLNSYVLVLPDYAQYQYGSWPPPVHQIYYLWWAETGIIGLAIHLAMWGGIVWTGLRNFRVADERLFAINAACVVGMLALALDGFVSFSLRVTPTLKTFWVLSAVIMAVRYQRLRHESGARAVISRQLRLAKARPLGAAHLPGLTNPT
jgi:hypothetical protein